MFSTRSFDRPWVAPCAGVAILAVLCAAFIAPIAGVGFVGDDIYRSTIPAYAYLSHLSFIAALGIVARSTDQAARSPLQALVLGIWFLRPTELVARCLQYGLFVANVFTFALIAARLFAARSAGVLATVCLFTTLQVRFGNDPLLGQTATSTIGCELLLLAIMALHYYIEKPERRRFVLLLCAFTIALLSDPSAVALVVIVPAVLALQRSWPRRKRTILWLSFAVLGVAISALGYVLIPGSSAAPSFGAVAGQIVAALPLAYRTLHPLVGGVTSSGNPPDQRFLGIPGAGPAGFFLAWCGMAAAYLALRSYAQRSQRAGVLYGATVGAALWITPALFAGGSASTTYAPLSTIYVQSFGVALLLTAALTATTRRSGRIEAAAAMLLLFVGLTLFGNVAQANLVAQREATTTTLRGMIEESGEARIFQTIPDGSTIALDAKAYPFRFSPGWRNASYLLFMYSGHRYKTVSVANLDRGSPGSNTWILRYDRPKEDRPREISLSRYVGGGTARSLVDQTIAFQVFDTSEKRADGLSHLDAGGRGMIASTLSIGSRSALVFVRRTCGPVEDRFALAPSTPVIGWGRGFFPDISYIPAEIVLNATVPYYLPTGHVWRLMGPKGDLNVGRDSCPQGPLILTMTVASAAPAVARVSSGTRFAFYAVSQFPSTVSFLIPDDGQQPARVHIQTDAPAAHPFDWAPRRQHGDFAVDARLFVTKPEARYL